MLALVSLADRVPARHPLRTIKQLADAALAELSPVFEALLHEDRRARRRPGRRHRSVPNRDRFGRSELTHPVQRIAGDDDFGPPPCFAARSQPDPYELFVPEDCVLHVRLAVVAGLPLPGSATDLVDPSDGRVSRALAGRSSSADLRNPSVCRGASPKTRRTVRAGSIATSLKRDWAPRRPDGLADYLSKASGVSHTVTSPRRTSARSNSRQLVTRYQVLNFGWTFELRLTRLVPIFGSLHATSRLNGGCAGHSGNNAPMASLMWW